MSGFSAGKYVYHMHAWYPPTEEGTDPLELVLGTVVNYNMGAGNPTWVICNSNMCS